MKVCKIYGNDELLDVLHIALKDGIPALLIGPTGTGKNTIIRFVAKNEQRTDIVRLSLTGETTVDDLIGHYQIKDRSTVWQDGSVTNAVRNGNILVLDEVNAAQPEVLFALQSLLDDDKCLTLTSHDNSVVHAHENFRVFATMNPTIGYSGTKDMNKAFMSRFGLVVEVNYIDPVSEKALISGVFPDLSEPDLMTMLETARIARKQLADEQLTYPLSTRDVLSWAEMTLKLKDITKAYSYTVVAKAGSEGKDLLDIMRQALDSVKNHQEYVESLIKNIDELLENFGKPITARELVRQEADEMLKTLERLQTIATDKERLSRELTKQIKDELSDTRQRVKDAANKLNSQMTELENQRQTIYQQGYDAAKADLLKKLGINTDKE